MDTCQQPKCGVRRKQRGSRRSLSSRVEQLEREFADFRQQLVDEPDIARLMFTGLSRDQAVSKLRKQREFDKLAPQRELERQTEAKRIRQQSEALRSNPAAMHLAARRFIRSLGTT